MNPHIQTILTALLLGLAFTTITSCSVMLFQRILRRPVSEFKYLLAELAPYGFVAFVGYVAGTYLF